MEWKLAKKSNYIELTNYDYGSVKTNYTGIVGRKPTLISCTLMGYICFMDLEDFLTASVEILDFNDLIIKEKNIL